MECVHTRIPLLCKPIQNVDVMYIRMMECVQAKGTYRRREKNVGFTSNQSFDMVPTPAVTVKLQG